VESHSSNSTSAFSTQDTSPESSQFVCDDLGKEVSPDPPSNISVERKAEILKLVDLHPKWSLSTLQAKGAKELKHHSYIKRWREQVQGGGTTFEKWNHIQRSTYEKFCEARSNHKQIKGSNLRSWALQASQSFRDDSFAFKASDSWLDGFKKKYRITSRKVTKLVTKREIKSSEDIQNSAKTFQILFKEISVKYRKDLIMNSDQVGFCYELISNRTLTHKGEKIVFGLAKSPTNLVTHSYTVQYLITMAGTIVGDVFLCFQEKSGRLGQRVENTILPVSNVTITCSTSGKLTTSLFEYYLDEVLLKNVKEDFLYLVDSWGGQTNVASYSSRFGTNGNPSCELKIIPKKCTSICQPLDTTFNRQLKYFARAIYEESKLHYNEDLNPVDEITTRNNIIRTHSLLHYQLSAPIFIPMILYSWFSSGLTEEKPSFLSVKEACFTFEPTETTNCSICSKQPRFIKCAKCRENVCFECFYYDYHFDC